MLDKYLHVLHNYVILYKQGIASDTIPSHCIILLTGLIAGWILVSLCTC